MTTKLQVLPLAQLLRLPNVFTAMADICLAGAATGAISTDTIAWLLVLLCSGSLYLSGMVWNDYFDRFNDAKHRPHRPIPSGRIRPMTALMLGLSLTVLGLTLAALSDLLMSARDHAHAFSTFRIALFLSIAILLYDLFLKHHLVTGPFGMGMCRALNIFLGLSVGSQPVAVEIQYHLAAIIGLYIAGVTGFARTEEVISNRLQLLAASLVIYSALIMALVLPSNFSPGQTPWIYPYLLIAYGFFIGQSLTKAWHHPEPRHVQRAVKRCILGLIVLDAILAVSFVGLAGLLILLLLPPAVALGKWIYST